jgi:beta-galactosidase
MTSTPASDPFLHRRIEALTDTPMQRKLRRLAPMPVGCVFLPWPGLTEDEARRHFRLMKELGFTCLKQTMPLPPEWPEERTFRVAFEEGIIPFWYAEGGYEDITPELLTRLGLPADMDIDAALAHPAMMAHQRGVIERQIARGGKASAPTAYHALGADPLAKAKTAQDMTVAELRARAHIVPGVVGDVKGHEIHPEAVPHFVAWLKQHYGSVAALQETWNCHHVGQASNIWSSWKTWEDVQRDFERIPTNEYRNLRDKMRFRAETFNENFIAARGRIQQIEAPEVPLRSGGEMGIFLPFASRGTDMELIARTMADYGSFYPSIHLTWHFEEVAYEVVRPIYLQAALTADWARGIWSATWESSGGPSWFSGGKAPFVKWAQDKTPGFTCHEGTITQMMLSYIAAGYRGFGFWTWNHRTAGWEGGEYAILDRNRQPTERARRMGAVAKAAVRLRRELWEAKKEPLVAILQDWDNEAFWAAMSVTGRETYKSEPIRARIGAGRALIDGNIPFEHCTPRDLREGLGARWAVIYLPAFISLSDELMDMLIAYAEQGGRVVLDLPSALFDGQGRVLETGPGTRFERLFGAILHEYEYARSVNIRYRLEGVDLEGFCARLSTTTARVAASYEPNGRTAVTEHTIGRGSAVILGVQAGLNCCMPGNRPMQDLLLRHVLGGHRPGYQCNGALCYRIAAPSADHYMLINDQGHAVSASLVPQIDGRWEDAVTGEVLPAGEPIAIAAEDARWIRISR